MKQSRVKWGIEADVECPHCIHDNDFMEVDEWHIWCEPGQNVETFGLDCPTMICERCGEEFEVTGSDY